MTAEKLLPAYPTMLDYYAAHALAGLLAYSPIDSGAEDQFLPEIAAEVAFDFAEAMLAERKLRQEATEPAGDSDGR